MQSIIRFTFPNDRLYWSIEVDRTVTLMSGWVRKHHSHGNRSVTMALSKIRSESVDLTDDFAFTGTVTGAGGNSGFRFIKKVTISSSNGLSMLPICSAQTTTTTSCFGR